MILGYRFRGLLWVVVRDYEQPCMLFRGFTLFLLDLEYRSAIRRRLILWWCHRKLRDLLHSSLRTGCDPLKATSRWWPKVPVHWLQMEGRSLLAFLQLKEVRLSRFPCQLSFAQTDFWFCLLVLWDSKLVPGYHIWLITVLRWNCWTSSTKLADFSSIVR